MQSFNELNKRNSLISDLIYPFEEPKDYFKYKAPKKIKGYLIKYDFYQFMNLPNSGQNMTRFKKGCLKSKAIIFENDFLQIGSISSIEIHNNGKNYLKIELYFLNKSDTTLVNSNFQYIGASSIFF